MAWDVTKLKFARSKTLDGPSVTALGLSFGSSGSKMYCADFSGYILEYDLGMNYDTFTETYVQRINTTLDGIYNPIDVEFNPTGDGMYVLNMPSSAIHYYILGTPWNISTAVYSISQDIFSYSATPQGWRFKPDGTMLYVLSKTSNLMIGYSLSPAWDISTLQKVQEIDLLSECSIGNKYGIDFKPDGTKMFMGCGTTRHIFEYGLTTAWNIESAKYIRSSGCTVQITNVKFNSDGTAVYVNAGFGYGGMNEYTLPMGKHSPVRSS